MVGIMRSPLRSAQDEAFEKISLESAFLVTRGWLCAEHTELTIADGLLELTAPAAPPQRL